MTCLFLASNPPTRAPFSDWVAQIMRIVERQTGERLAHPGAYNPGTGLGAYYDSGLSPLEVAEDLMAD